MTTTRTNYKKTATLKLSQNMTGKAIHFTVDGDQLTARYFGNEQQLAEMLEVAAKDSSIFKEAVKLAAAALNSNTENEVFYRSMALEIKKHFKDSFDTLTVKDAMDIFSEKTGIKTNESKFKAAMTEAGFKLHSRSGGGNVKGYYMVEKI